MSEAAQLDDLRMVDKDVDVDTKFAKVPGVDLRIRRLKHDPLGRQLLHDGRDDVGAPRLDILSDTLRLDHETFDTSVEELLAQVDQLAGV